jgi:hypothetical protein
MATINKETLGDDLSNLDINELLESREEWESIPIGAEYQKGSRSTFYTHMGLGIMAGIGASTHRVRLTSVSYLRYATERGLTTEEFTEVQAFLSESLGTDYQANADMPLPELENYEA